MRIAMVLEVPFPPHPRVEKEMRTLTRAGHELHIIAYASEGRPEREFLEGLGTVHRVSFPMGLRPLRLLFGGRHLYHRYWLPRVRRLIGELRPDALHVHDLPLARAAFLVARDAGIPLILDFHENWPGFMRWAAKSISPLARALVDFGGWERYEAEAVRWPARIIVVDPSNRDRLVDLYGLPAERITVVGNTPELDRLLPQIERARSIPKRAGVTMLYVGGLDYGRGIHTVLDALARRAKDLGELRFVVVGKGSYQAKLEQRALQLGLGTRVEFHGWQPHDRLAEYIATADIGVVPHVRDELTETTIPNKVFEYMAGELPVLTSDCAPLVRVVSEATCGLVFRSEDVDSCGEQLVRLSADAGLRRSLGANGYDAVMREHNWDRSSRALVEIYAALSAKRGRAEPVHDAAPRAVKTDVSPSDASS